MAKKMLDKKTSDDLIKFYGGVEEAESYLNSMGKGTIVICPNCHRVDISVIKHVYECDPLAEQQRQESQEIYWK